MLFESLEARRLMSTVAAFADGSQITQSGSGTLAVIGAPNAFNNIVVFENAGSLDIRLNGHEVVLPTASVNSGKPITVQDGHQGSNITVHVQSFASNIKAGSGIDYIQLADTRAIGATLQDSVDGGKGNDNIELVASPKVTINGGDGDDVININTGAIDNATVFDYDNAVIVVNAGSGNDTINIYDGTMKLDGGSGIDSLTLYNGSTSMSKNVESTTVA